MERILKVLRPREKRSGDRCRKKEGPPKDFDGEASTCSMTITERRREERRFTGLFQRKVPYGKISRRKAEGVYCTTLDGIGAGQSE